MLIKYNDDLPTRKSISKLCFIHYTSFKIKEKKICKSWTNSENTDE